MSNVVTSEWEITALLGSVNINKACGPDGISNKLIKICADGITKVFTDFVNLSLRSGVFPDDWKQANVTPIFKKDDRQLKSNYRPVSLLNAFPGKNIRWDPANPNWDPRCVPSGIPPSFGGIPLGIPPGIMEHPRWDPTWDPAK